MEASKRCQCCGSRTQLVLFVLADGRTWCSCTCCAALCVYCLPHLEGAVRLSKGGEKYLKEALIQQLEEAEIRESMKSGYKS